VSAGAVTPNQGDVTLTSPVQASTPAAAPPCNRKSRRLAPGQRLGTPSRTADDRRIVRTHQDPRDRGHVTQATRDDIGDLQRAGVLAELVERAGFAPERTRLTVPLTGVYAVVSAQLG
jgi:hypothetical protein